jgi:hypothetical protein
MKKPENKRPSHACEFWVIWQGQHWRMASMSWHVKKGIGADNPNRILFDSFGTKSVMAPLAEIVFCETAPV